MSTRLVTPITTPAVTTPSRASSWVAEHPLLAFFAWFFTVGQLIAFLPVIVEAQGFELPRQPFIVASTLVGLLLPAVVITRLTEGRAASRRLLRSAVDWRLPIRWYLLALLVVPATSLLITWFFLGSPSDLGFGSVASALVAGLMVQLVLTSVPNNIAEEVAWSGFVQSRLQRTHRPAVAALITAPLFALQHVSLAVGVSVGEAVVLLVLLAVLSVPFRFLTGWTYNRTGSLLLVGLLHGAGNAVAGGSGFGEGALARLYPDSAVALMAHLLAFFVLGLVVLIASRGHLGATTDPQTWPRRKRVG